MAKAGYGDLEVGAETTSPQAIHPQGTAAIPGITFSADTDTGIYRAGANIVGVAIGGTGQLTVTDGVLLPVTTNDIDLGSSTVQFKDAFIDGTLEADAITVGGSTLASVIAGTTITNATNATNITVADSTDTTCFVGLWESVTGAQAPKSDLGLTYNAGTGMLTATGLTGPLTGVASTATALATARDIGGVSFDGTGNIDLPGVNAAGNQATSGLAATATLAATTTALATARDIGGVSFDGTGNIDLPGVNAAGNQATSGLAATATLAAASTAATVTVNDATAENNLIPFVADAATSTGNHGLEMDTDFHYNPNTGVLTVGSITGGVTGSATQITVTAVTDNDTVYPVFATGTSGANTPEVASALTYNPSTGLLTSTGFSGPITGNLTGTLQTAVQAGITTVGTIDTGVWEGTTVAVAQGGTGATALTDKAVLITQDSGTDTVASVAMDASGELLIGGTSGPAVATITAGSNITITNGDGSITITAASGGGVPNPFFFS